MNQVVINPAPIACLERRAAKNFTATYLPLEEITKPNLTTDECAFYLNRRPQTLRVWAMRDGIDGLRPTRINGYLAWPTAQIKALAGVAV